MSMPVYLEKSLERLQSIPKVYPYYLPHVHVPIQHATKNTRQYATSPDTSPLLGPKQTKYNQSVPGSFLYYGRTSDHTILPALNKIESEQSSPTKKLRIKLNV